MSYGLSNDMGAINSAIYQCSVDMARAIIRARNLHAFLVEIGGATGLQAAPYSMSAADATNLVQAVNDLVTLGNVYQGNATVITAYNFDQYVGPARGTGFF